MRLSRCFPILLLTLILIFATLTIYAASVGKIKGTVTDSKIGEAIISATIMIEGTTMGARTDFDGNFVIVGVPPGTYNLLFNAVGYESVKMTDVIVNTDSTTERNVQLKPTIVETGKITTVCGHRKGIDFNCTGTQSVRTARGNNHKKYKRVATVDDLLARESGITRDANGQLHIRGGRSGETCYLVDGVRYSDPLAGHPQMPPAHGGTAIVNGQALDAMFFKNFGVNPFVDTEDDHLSTFASDVDDASFIIARAYFKLNQLPPSEAIRTEEFVNHFDYDYDAPYNEAFSVHIEGAPSEFGQNCSLLRIALKGQVIPDHLRKPANLVFVIDVSGSMDRENRLGLVKRSLYELLDQLDESDKVGIVIYGSTGQVMLEPTSIANRYEIEKQIDALRSMGSTNAEEGIVLGYDMANRHFEEGKINRVILCSDGVANVGTTGPNDLLEQIKEYADAGITLTTIGFGMGNYNDVLMEKLGNKGNGMYAYVDDIEEARKIFKDNLTGNLQVIARDVKIQVDFNPEVVSRYRLLGYENRDVADDKFRDDKEDGGEVGSGHSVTALYEVKFHKPYAHGPIGTVYVRYKDPDTFEVTEFSENMTFEDFADRFENTSTEFKLAAVAAEFSEILRKSYWARGTNLDAVRKLARKIDKEFQSDETKELVRMISKARKFREELAKR